MSTRSYKDAVQHLNTLQSNAATLEAVRAAGTAHRNQLAIPEMIEYLGRIGHTPSDLNALNVIHITGTKGKGSTSAFLSSILRKVKPDWKIGLYTSPHLVAVRERIRVNGAPISELDFSRYFFEVWDRLQLNPNRAHPETSLMPSYFKFLSVMAFHAFLDLKVDATILEVGVGGTYDSTNVVPKPIVTGITSLGIDHVAVLGTTLKEIAWQKAGIFKAGVPAITTPQPEEAMETLRDRAKELQASSFEIANSDYRPDCPLGLAGVHQKSNATLAIHLARSFIHAKLPDDPKYVPGWDHLPTAFVEGLGEVRWPGRCQMVPDPVHPDTRWYLDGAHTIESLQFCITWFATPGVGLPQQNQGKQPLRVLIFNCTNGRSGGTFLKSMYDELSKELLHHGVDVPSEKFFDHVIFCTNVTYQDGGFKGDLTTIAIPESELAELKTQRQLASAWQDLLPEFPASNVHVLPSVEHAIQAVRHLDPDNDRQKSVLVTGSLHLVGGVVEVAGLSEVAL